MLLTIKQPTHQGYNLKSSHDYTPPTPPSTSRFSPAIASTGHFQTILKNSNFAPRSTSSQSIVQAMSTPHRGLPPPAAMTLPQPAPQSSSMGQSSLNQPPLNQSMGQLPAPPQQWQGAEESMRNWLHAKAEEEKRRQEEEKTRQEEEKTRQEGLRLEQRKIEQGMLRDSLSGGIPPYMIPMVFAGMGGGNLPNTSLEWAQHHMDRLQQPHHQAQPLQLLPSQQASPEQIQRQGRQPLGSQPHPAPMTLPSTPIGTPGTQQAGGFLPSYQLSPASRSRQNAQAQTTIVRPPPTSHLPRLNTGEMTIQQPPAGPSMQVLPAQPAHPLQQTQSAQQQDTQSSPSIYFHHWQPPISQAGSSSSNQPATSSDPTSSPKKRKATGPQQPALPPTSQPQYTSPPFSQTGSPVSNTPSGRRHGHSRQRSDMSSRGFDYGRPSSRHHHTESNFSVQSMTSPRQPEHAPTALADAGRRRSSGVNPVSSLLQQSNAWPQSQSQSQQGQQRDSHYAAAPEMRHEKRHMTPENENPRRLKSLKRDDARD